MTTTTASTAELLDPTSAAYKKARRQFYKATKNRPQNVEQDWTPFRAAEKRFKARFPPPDLSTVLDLATLDPSRQKELDEGVWKGSANPDTFRRMEGTSAAAYVVPAISGLIVLPSYLGHEEQRQVVRWALEKQARDPNPTNLDIHYRLPSDGLWNTCIRDKDTGEDTTIKPKALDADVVEEPSKGPRQLVNNTPISVENYKALAETPKPPPAPSASVTASTASDLLTKLRWANIGWYYHWDTKQYDFSYGKGEIDGELRRLCKSAVANVRWDEVYAGMEYDDWESWGETYEPDAGIVNFYQTKDTLMAHVDRSEVCKTSPLVSISLGNAAVFLIGSDTRDTEPVSILLRSGDVVIMTGVCRRAYHGVPRILEGTLPAHLKAEAGDESWAPFAEYLETTRINVNVRQVFPKGFEAPSVA